MEAGLNPPAEATPVLEGQRALNVEFDPIDDGRAGCHGHVTPSAAVASPDGVCTVTYTCPSCGSISNATWRGDTR